MMIPELVLGMAYLSVFTAVGDKLGMGALILTHTTFCIPYVLINVKSRLIAWIRRCRKRHAIWAPARCGC